MSVNHLIKKIKIPPYIHSNYALKLKWEEGKFPKLLLMSLNINVKKSKYFLSKRKVLKISIFKNSKSKQNKMAENNLEEKDSGEIF